MLHKGYVICRNMTLFEMTPSYLQISLTPKLHTLKQYEDFFSCVGVSNLPKFVFYWHTQYICFLKTQALFWKKTTIHIALKMKSKKISKLSQNNSRKPGFEQEISNCGGFFPVLYLSLLYKTQISLLLVQWN